MTNKLLTRLEKLESQIIMADNLPTDIIWDIVQPGPKGPERLYSMRRNTDGEMIVIEEAA